MKNLKVLIVSGMFAICLGLFAHFSLMFKDICYGEYDGSAISINSGAEYTISGGTITSSKEADYGGGVYVGSDCLLIINGGTITGNSATSGGGGIYTNSNINFSSGTITSNTAGYGGGIANNGVLTITGGTISGNSASTSGGGIYTWSTIIMSSGYIQNNSAAYGGAVYIDLRGGVFTCSGGTISGNSASTSGGGVQVGGTFTLKGGTIKSNKATGKNGGGILVKADATATMSSGYVQSNSAAYGAGVYVEENGEFSFSGGTISNNTVETAGGGVYSFGTFNLKGGTISGNTGTGAYVRSGSSTMSSGYVQSNSAKYGAGAYVYSGGTFTMSGGTISNNTAETSGGGIYVAGTFNMTGGTISGNFATYGSGVFVASTGTFNYTSGTINDLIYINNSNDTSLFVLKKAPTSTLNIKMGTIAEGTKICKLDGITTLDLSKLKVADLPSGYQLKIRNVDGANWVVATNYVDVTISISANISTSYWTILDLEANVSIMPPYTVVLTIKKGSTISSYGPTYTPVGTRYYQAYEIRINNKAKYTLYGFNGYTITNVTMILPFDRTGSGGINEDCGVGITAILTYTGALPNIGMPDEKLDDKLPKVERGALFNQQHAVLNDKKFVLGSEKDSKIA